MNAKIKKALKEQVHCKPVLTVIENKGRVVDNSKLPTGCKYCELRWEQQSW